MANFKQSYHNLILALEGLISNPAEQDKLRVWRTDIEQKLHQGSINHMQACKMIIRAFSGGPAPTPRRIKPPTRH